MQESRSKAVERARMDFDSFHAAAEAIKRPTPMTLLGLSKMGIRSIDSWRKVMRMQPTENEISEAEYSQLYISKRLRKLGEAAQ